MTKVRLGQVYLGHVSKWSKKLKKNLPSALKVKTLRLFVEKCISNDKILNREAFKKANNFQTNQKTRCTKILRNSEIQNF